MVKTRFHDVAVIYYMNGAIKNYIASLSKGCFDKTVPGYTTECLKALRFCEPVNAQNAIATIVNSYRIGYKIELISVQVEPFPKFGRTVKHAFV